MISKIKIIIIHLSYFYVIPILGFLFIKLISLTYRVKVITTDKIDFHTKKPTIYASWHQRFFFAIEFLTKKKPITAIISQNKDGELVARIAKIMGWDPIRGSSSKNGAKALKNAIAMMYSGYSVGHAVDGPQGPFGIVKPGIIKIAQLTQARIVPIIISSDSYWIFNSWDYFIVPKPFTKVIVNFPCSYKVPRYMSDKEFEKKRLNFEKKMFEFYENADLASQKFEKK